MSDTNDPFAAFKEGTPPTQDQAKPKKARAKKPRSARPANGGVPTDAAQPSASSASGAETKKHRTRKARKPRGLKLDPIIVFEAAVGLDFGAVNVIAQTIEQIQGFPKKSRTRIVAALNKIFA